MSITGYTVRPLRDVSGSARITDVLVGRYGIPFEEWVDKSGLRVTGSADLELRVTEEHGISVVSAKQGTLRTVVPEGNECLSRILYGEPECVVVQAISPNGVASQSNGNGHAKLPQIRFSYSW